MPSPLEPWETLSTELAFEHPWYRLRREKVRTSSGQVIDDYFVAERPDVVLVFALTPADDVVFVRQWKQGRRQFMVELPGGLIEPGEAPALAAARELREETGYASTELRQIGAFEQDPTGASNTALAFLAVGTTHVGEQSLDEHEAIEVVLIPLAELEHAVVSGRISSAGTVATIHRALIELAGAR